ncbi:hypothetical protein KC19_1G000900 [Ceratodon purpureus]|uniref:Uncharacterized protein n=1 Tax=Ceratodon purpureus TaxID=3225 RepID=A0A8T0J1S3_CERPU|nr:hypothetical protein KC19_1G000900 [Ceratodon purpureus]
MYDLGLLILNRLPASDEAQLGLSGVKMFVLTHWIAPSTHYRLLLRLRLVIIQLCFSCSVIRTGSFGGG